MTTFVTILRFVSYVYIAFAFGGIIWFFTIGDGALREIHKFFPVLLISMVVALPGILIWLTVLSVLKSKGLVVSEFTHIMIAFGTGAAVFGLVGGWVWYEYAHTVSALGRSLLRGFIWPTLIMSIVCVPLAFIFARYNKLLGLEKLF